jgi:hypothetical protein
LLVLQTNIQNETHDSIEDACTVCFTLCSCNVLI